MRAIAGFWIKLGRSSGGSPALPIAVLPVGAGTKEHGPHLPGGTDLMMVEELARRVVEACPVILMPALAYGYFPAFLD